MKKIILLLCCLGFVQVVVAQQLIRERVYRVDVYKKGVNASTLTRQGDILLSGPANVPPGGISGYDNIFILLKPNLDTLWTKKGVRMPSGDQGIKQTPDNGFAYCSTVWGAAGAGDRDMILQKLDYNGSVEWTKTYHAVQYDYGRLLLLMPDKGFLMGGAGNLPGPTYSRVTLTRTDSLGNVAWIKGYNWGFNEVIDMKFTQNGNIITAGTTSRPSIGNRLRLLLLNQQGDSLKAGYPIVINSSRVETMRHVFNSVTTLSDNGFLVTADADTAGPTFNSRLGFVLKVDHNLQKSWSYIHRTNPFKQIIFTKAKELADGTVLVLAYDGGLGSNKFYFFHLSATGSLLNVYPFTSAATTKLQAVTLEALPDSSFIIGGYGTTVAGQGMYVAKVKIAGIAQVLSTSKEMAVQPEPLLGFAYPNPAQAEVVIPYTLPAGCKTAKLVISEVVSGRQLKAFTLAPNEKHGQVQVDLRNFSSGLYTYSLFVDERPVATKKLSVVK